MTRTISKMMFAAYVIFFGEILLNLTAVITVAQGQLFHKVEISRSFLNVGTVWNSSQALYATLRGSVLRFSCSIACQNIEQCNLWCPDPSSPTTCLYFDIYVVPGYQERNKIDALTCYTRRPKDYVIGANVEGSESSGSYSMRSKGQLTDGLYDSNISNCYRSGDFSNPWFKLDLKGLKPIRRIMFVLQPNEAAGKMYDIKALVGDEDLPEASFEQYQLFGYFKILDPPNKKSRSPRKFP